MFSKWVKFRRKEASSQDGHAGGSSGVIGGKGTPGAAERSPSKSRLHLRSILHRLRKTKTARLLLSLRKKKVPKLVCDDGQETVTEVVVRPRKAQEGVLPQEIHKESSRPSDLNENICRDSTSRPVACNGGQNREENGGDGAVCDKNAVVIEKNNCKESKYNNSDRVSLQDDVGEEEGVFAPVGKSEISSDAVEEPSTVVILEDQTAPSVAERSEEAQFSPEERKAEVTSASPPSVEEEDAVTPLGRGEEDAVTPQGRGEEDAVTPQGRGEKPALTPQGRGEGAALTPQGRGEEAALTPQGRREEAALTPQGRGEEAALTPQGRGEEDPLTPQGRGEKDALTPQGRGEEDPLTPQGRGEEDALTPQIRGEEDALTPQGRGEEEDNDSSLYKVTLHVDLEIFKREEEEEIEMIDSISEEEEEETKVVDDAAEEPTEAAQSGDAQERVSTAGDSAEDVLSCDKNSVRSSSPACGPEVERSVGSCSDVLSNQSDLRDADPRGACAVEEGPGLPANRDPREEDSALQESSWSPVGQTDLSGLSPYELKLRGLLNGPPKPPRLSQLKDTKKEYSEPEFREDKNCTDTMEIPKVCIVEASDSESSSDGQENACERSAFTEESGVGQGVEEHTDAILEPVNLKHCGPGDEVMESINLKNCESPAEPLTQEDDVNGDLERKMDSTDVEERDAHHVDKISSEENVDASTNPFGEEEEGKEELADSLKTVEEAVTNLEARQKEKHLTAANEDRFPVNPFEDDDDTPRENLGEFAVRVITTPVPTPRRFRNTYRDAQEVYSPDSYQKLSCAVSTPTLYNYSHNAPSTSSIPREFESSYSYNPFEDDDEVEVTKPVNERTSLEPFQRHVDTRHSVGVAGSQRSQFMRAGPRASLPTAVRIRSRKRPAPLPPGQSHKDSPLRRQGAVEESMNSVSSLQNTASQENKDPSASPRREPPPRPPRPLYIPQTAAT